MSTHPVIFISAVSKELKTARQTVAHTLTALGYSPEWQDIFGTESGPLLHMLRQKVDTAAAVVQLIGNCYGAEPDTPTEDFGRVSYTQYEALYARRRKKPVYYITLAPGFPADPHDPEPDALRDLQQAYLQQIKSTGDLYHSPADLTALENNILKLRDDLKKLRRRTMQWAAAISVLLLLIAGGVAWVKWGQGETNTKLDASSQREADLLLAIRELPAALASTARPGPDHASADPLPAAYALLEINLHLPPGTLAKELPAFAAQLLLRPDTSFQDRANALLVQKKFAEAEAAALQAKDEALRCQPPNTAGAIVALMTAASAACEQIHYPQALGHARATAALTDQRRDPVEWARVEYMMAYILYYQGQSAAAEKILRPLIQVREKELGPENPETLNSRDCLANALNDQGKSAEAEAEHRAVLALLERVLGPEHPDTLASRSNLAIALYDQGKNAEAEAEHRVVLAIRERVLGLEHPDALKSRNNLAIVLRAQGRNSEAEAEHRAVLALRERVRGPEHPETLNSRNNLANTLQAQGKNAEAEAEHRAVLAVMERVLGPEHPDTLDSRNNLANALQAQGKNAEAEAEHSAVLALRVRVLGPEHPATLSSRNSLANIFRAQGKNAEAEAEHRAVLTLRVRVLGPEHPETLNSRNNLANALRAQGKNAEAEAENRAVLAVRERVQGLVHPDTLNSRNNLANVLRAQGKKAEAEAEHRAVLAVRERVLGPEHPDTIGSHYNLALCLRDQKKNEAARQEAQLAWVGWKKVLGEGHPDTVKARQLLDQLLSEK